VRAVANVAADPEFRRKSVEHHAPLRYLAPADFETVLRPVTIRSRMWKKRRGSKGRAPKSVSKQNPA
jgi:hypothetical protein